MFGAVVRETPSTLMWPLSVSATRASSRPIPAGSSENVRRRPAGAGHVPCDIIALVLAHQDAARIDKFFAQSIGHDLEARESSPVVAACRRPHIAFDEDPNRETVMERPVPDANRPRVEPEIIPPGRAGPRPQRGASFDGRDTQRIYVAQVGPFGFAMVALVVALVLGRAAGGGGAAQPVPGRFSAQVLSRSGTLDGLSAA